MWIEHYAKLGRVGAWQPALDLLWEKGSQVITTLQNCDAVFARWLVAQTNVQDSVIVKFVFELPLELWRLVSGRVCLQI